MLGVSYPPQGKEKTFYQYMAANTYILRYSPSPHVRTFTIVLILICGVTL